MNLYFTYDFPGTLGPFTLFITVKTSTKLILGHSDKVDIELKTLAIMNHALQKSQNFITVVEQRTAKKCSKNYNACAQPLCCSLNLLIGDIPVAVVVFLNSLSPGSQTLCQQTFPVWSKLELKSA